MKRIWFNSWFSSAYHFIDMLKLAGYEVVASNYNPDCVYKEIADEFYIEPTMEETEEYLEYCLKFCQDKKIDIFFPKHGLDNCVHNRHRFDEIGVKVVCEENIEMYDLLNNKEKAYEFFKTYPELINVPEYYKVNTVEEFQAAYKALKNKYDKVVIKYAEDEGATSYNKIAERKAELHEIKVNPGKQISYDFACKCLSEKEYFNDLLVMPYLPGLEISVDCLTLPEGVVAVARYKHKGRITALSTTDEIVDKAKKIGEIIQLTAPYNVQFRTGEDGKIYLLEINTRLAGGSWKTKFMNCPFPVLAVQKLEGYAKYPKIEPKEMKLSKLEHYIPITIEES